MNKGKTKGHKPHKRGAERKQRPIPYPNRLCIKVSNSDLAKLEFISKEFGQSISVCVREALNDYLTNCEVPAVQKIDNNQLTLFRTNFE